MERKSESDPLMFTYLDFTHPKPNPNKKKFLPKIETPKVFKLTQQRSQQEKAFTKNINSIYLHTHPNQNPNKKNFCPETEVKSLHTQPNQKPNNSKFLP
jgi:hypothetical protein